jgi:hypothetical protein
MASGRAGEMSSVGEPRSQSALERSSPFTIIHPRLAESDLRESRAAAATMAAVGGEARLAAVAAMRTSTETPGAAASPRRTTLLHAMGRGGRRPDLVAAVGEGAGGRRSGLDAMVVTGERKRERRAARSSSASPAASGGEEGAISSPAQPSASVSRLGGRGRRHLLYRTTIGVDG